MSSRPSFHSATPLLSAISSLKDVHICARGLNEDIRDLLQHLEIVENLPESSHLCQVSGWRTRLLSKMRSKIVKLDEEYSDIVESKWPELLRVIRKDGPAMSSISFTFANDMQLVHDFYNEAHLIASGNDLLTTNIRSDIPILPLNIEKAICRIISDFKTLDS